jgi:ubiquinone/menaquinone biosynthesis C-methylase UbiE
VAGEDVRSPFFARTWPKGRTWMDEHGAREHRRRMLGGLAGRVVEVGAGDGANFALYPPAVTEVLAAEPEPQLREQAVAAARTAPVPVTVSGGTAEALPVEDGWADALVFSLVLCTVPDQDAALEEARRVVRPGGELRFFEHVQADGGPLRLLLTVADRSTLWPRLAGGCHPSRDTEAAIRAAGFTVSDVDRFRFRAAPVGPAVPFVLGRAVRR